MGFPPMASAVVERFQPDDFGRSVSGAQPAARCATSDQPGILAIGPARALSDVDNTPPAGDWGRRPLAH